MMYVFIVGVVIMMLLIGLLIDKYDKMFPSKSRGRLTSREKSIIRFKEKSKSYYATVLFNQYFSSSPIGMGNVDNHNPCYYRLTVSFMDDRGINHIVKVYTYNDTRMGKQVLVWFNGKRAEILE